MQYSQIFQNGIKIFFDLAMFLNGILFIPQIIKITQSKTVKGLSFITFFGLNFIQFIEALQGYFIRDYQLMWGMIFSFVCCAVVTALIVFHSLLDDQKK